MENERFRLLREAAGDGFQVDGSTDSVINRRIYTKMKK